MADINGDTSSAPKAAAAGSVGAPLRPRIRLHRPSPGDQQPAYPLAHQAGGGLRRSARSRTLGRTRTEARSTGSGARSRGLFALGPLGHGTPLRDHGRAGDRRPMRRRWRRSSKPQLRDGRPPTHPGRNSPGRGLGGSGRDSAFGRQAWPVLARRDDALQKIPERQRQEPRRGRASGAAGPTRHSRAPRRRSRAAPSRRGAPARNVASGMRVSPAMQEMTSGSTGSQREAATMKPPERAKSCFARLKVGLADEAHARAGGRSAGRARSRGARRGSRPERRDEPADERAVDHAERRHHHRVRDRQHEVGDEQRRSRSARRSRDRTGTRRPAGPDAGTPRPGRPR